MNVHNEQPGLASSPNHAGEGCAEALCIEARGKWKTWWQWLQAGRIPSDTATWESGGRLNSVFPYGTRYGAKSVYCHMDDTREAADQEELDEAEEYYNKWKKDVGFRLNEE